MQRRILLLQQFQDDRLVMHGGSPLNAEVTASGGSGVSRESRENPGKRGVETGGAGAMTNAITYRCLSLVVPRVGRAAQRFFWCARFGMGERDESTRPFGRCPAVVVVLPAATLRCPLPVREGEREGGGGYTVNTFSPLAAATPLNQSFAEPAPPMSIGGRDEQKPSRFHQRTD